jgi:hypothetical protein
VAQEDEVRSGGSYLSQNDLRLHFGLGTHQSVDKVEIFWPSGSIEVLSHLPVDQFSAVREDKGIVESR